MNNNSAISSIEEVLIGGDLSKLSPADRLNYYQRVCESLGLNPLTKPFDYIKLSGRMTLYANKDCANQLRSLHKVSISKCDTEIREGIFIVTVTANTKDGRSDCDIGCIPIKNLSGEALGNAMMKCVTKAKRRVTLSICGLGWLDQSEIESIPEAKIIEASQPALNPATTIADAKSQPAQQQDPVLRDGAECWLKDLNFGHRQIQMCLMANFSKDHLDNLTNNQLTKLIQCLAHYRTTSELLKDLKWTPQQGKQFLADNFAGKTTRAELTLNEILDFVDYLKTEISDFNANPTPPTTNNVH